MEWKIEQCDFEGAKIMETRFTTCTGNRVRHEPEQVATISMATPEAMAMIAAAPEMLAALKGARTALRKVSPFIVDPDDTTHGGAQLYCGESLDEINEVISNIKKKASHDQN